MRGGACPSKVRGECATGVPSSEAMARNPTLSAAAAHGRRGADPGDPGPGHEVWKVRRPAHHGVAAECGVAGGPRSSAAHLATRRAEGTAEAADFERYRFSPVMRKRVFRFPIHCTPHSLPQDGNRGIIRTARCGAAGRQSGNWSGGCPVRGQKKRSKPYCDVS